MNENLKQDVYDYTRLAAEQAKRQDSILGRLFRRNKKEADGLLGMLGGILAATYGYKGGYLAGTNLGQVQTNGALSVVNINWSFATIAAARTAAGATAITTADVLQIISLLAKTWVPVVFVQPTTAEGATMTIDVGDGDDTDGYINDGSINATTMLSSLVTTAYSVAVGGGKFYAADDTIDMIPNNATPATAVVQLFAVCVDLRSYRS